MRVKKFRPIKPQLKKLVEVKKYEPLEKPLNQHAIDMINILTSVALRSLVGAAILSSAFCLLMTISFLHLIYMIPIISFLIFVSYFLYQIKCRGFPN